MSMKQCFTGIQILVIVLNLGCDSWWLSFPGCYGGVATVAKE